MSLLRAAGRAAPAGLNAPLALFLAGLIARVSDELTLSGRFTFLGQTWFLLLVSAWLLFELAVDKLPRHPVNDLLNALLRPASAALLFAATTTPLSDVHPLLAVAAGAAIGAAMNRLKSAYRRRIAGRAAGLGDVGGSMAEDALVVPAVVLAVFAPPISIALLALGIAAMLALTLKAPVFRPA